MGIHIGTSGWSYPHWENVLYSPGLPPSERLGVYTAHFGTAELNASYYRWPGEGSFRSWNRRLPPGFQLSVKAPRGLTHAKRLYGPEGWIERMASGWHALRDRRGVMLVQLPPTMQRDDERLRYFLAALPDWMRVAVEFRHPSWHVDAVFELLERHGAAYCVMSGAGLVCALRATSPTVYLRLHGPSHDHLYGGSYSDDDLAWWAQRIREWEHGGHDVYAYFNNDGDGNAVRNAWTLRGMLGG
ncbi:DUF72 domain-containing protein [Rathayibacter sp. YIM 133350]|uniref:DUF72 domain-containing protein n=1 Tax=Rathayibacter sp. YIM 133350 TaxID=3131992 RepID=UPI00307F729B